MISISDCKGFENSFAMNNGNDVNSFQQLTVLLFKILI